MTWRKQAQIIIQQAIREGRAQGMTQKQMKKLIRERYPFGDKTKLTTTQQLNAKYNYRVWLQEVKKALYREMNGKQMMLF